MVSAYKDNEQDLYLPRVIDTVGKNIVIHQHTKGTERNIAILSGLLVRPVIHLRNIYDCIVSLRIILILQTIPGCFLRISIETTKP
jgi:hypothetical protein